MATNWDANKPAGTTKIRLSDEQIRANNTALEDAMARDHNFPGAEGTDAGEHTLIVFHAPVAGGGDPGTDKGALFIKDVGGKAELHYEDEDSNEMQLTFGGSSPFPPGTKMYFYQHVAPAGWTIDAACGDALLAVRGGWGTYSVSGGNQAGTWTQPSHTHAGPSHTHDLAFPPGGWPYSMTNAGPTEISTQTGGDSSKITARTLTTGGASTGATGAGGTPNTYRPLAQVGIIAIKD